MKKLPTKHQALKYNGARKILLIMKLSGVLLLVGFLQVSAAGLSQNNRINLELEKAPLEELIAAIEDQTDYRFVYLNENLRNKQITVKAKRAPVTKLLDRALSEAGIDYQIISDNLVVITSNNEYTSTVLQPRIITGTITDEDGQPLVGVSVSVKGTTLGTITNVEGKYELEVPDDAEELWFSYVGMTTQELAIGNLTIIDLVMASDYLGLEEVVVVGYGTKKKVNLTGAVSVADKELMENRPISNVQQALQGLVPNLLIAPTTAGGEPGGEMSMNIRGLTSFAELDAESEPWDDESGKSAPYVLVDGIPMGINDIDPNDIESVSVLKDAASTSIYGARAAYGVILITTKKGQTGASINYSNNFGWSSPTIWPEIEQGMGWAHALNDARRNSGGSPYSMPEGHHTILPRPLTG